MNSPIKIAIAEDYEMERVGLIALLKEFDDLEVILAESNGKELLESFKKTTPDIVLLDIEMHIMGGRETLKIITAKFPELKVIMLTEHFENRYIIEFINKGARAFLSKNNRVEKIVETIRRVHVYGKCYDNIVTNILSKANPKVYSTEPAQKRPDLDLTIREIEVLRLMCNGKDNRAIATILFVDVRTAEKHRGKIWLKTKCKNIVELMDFAFKHNLISF